MQPVMQERELSTHGATSSAKFSISSKGTAHIMRILRDTLYSDKILAVIREYASNAWDAQRAAGKGDQPIKVNFPTNFEPSLTIRDYGKGLSEEDVYNLYIQYGESTKRDTNDEVGFLGIGNKSGFAYSDSFSIVSYHNGTKTIYVANLDPTDEGVLSKFHSEPCGDESGMEIQIPVLEKDIQAFKERGSKILPYFNPPPVTNIPIVPHDWASNPKGFRSRCYATEYIAVMGCIPYRFDPKQILPDLKDPVLHEFISRNQLLIPLQIGTADISASREELKYSDLTKNALKKAARELLDHILETSTSVLSDPNVPGLTKRQTLQRINEVSPLSVPRIVKQFFTKNLHHNIWFSPRVAHSANDSSRDYQNFISSQRVSYDVSALGGERRSRHSVPGHFSSYRLPQAFYIKDTKAIKNRVFEDKSLACIVTPRPRFKIEEVKKELESHMKELYIDGIPIMLTSELPLVEKDKITSQKHNKQNATVLKYNLCNAKPPSANWDEVDHVPSEEDVYVVLESFQATIDNKPFTEIYSHDMHVFKTFNVKMPTVWGYRNTKGNKNLKPVGTHYLKWRLSEFEKILDGKMKAKVDMISLKSCISNYYLSHGALEKLLAASRRSLSKDHKIAQYIEAICDASAFPVKENERVAILIIANRLGYNGKGLETHEKFMSEISKYPLISRSDFFSRFDSYLEYIEAIDLLRRSQQKVLGPSA